MSPYDSLPNFFNKRSKFNKTGLQNIVNLHHSQGDLQKFIKNKITKLNNRQEKVAKRLTSMQDDSCERHQ
jgi:hypothetical protein